MNYMNCIILAGLFLASSSVALARTQQTEPSRSERFEISGWAPYWNVKNSIDDARKHLDVLTTLHPFGFSVKQDGTLNDLLDIGSRDWKKLFKKAASEDIKIIPTVMWSDNVYMDIILNNQKTRADHVAAISKMVREGKYDGVDIDYEGKKITTGPGYSAFLQELKKAIGSKLLVCTIEPRTPPESLYRVIPVDLEYANDYSVISRVCDRVQIMAYDQGRADIKLNDARKGAPYLPVADIDWVEKVMEHTMKFIPKEKLMLGVATYGREYVVTVLPDWFRDYKRVYSINPVAAIEDARQYSIKPARNSGGELSFSYFATTSPFRILSSLPVPVSTLDADKAWVRALMFANATKQPVQFNLVWWSDAVAIKQKIDLARKLGLLGVAVYKVDGGEDHALWKAFGN
jgi:spore germination protein